MTKEKFIGQITSVSAGTKQLKLSDGSKHLKALFLVKLESNDIDYESIEKFNSAISSTLLNIQPMPFVSVNFGEQMAYNMALNLFSEEVDEIERKSTEEAFNNTSDASYGNVMITNLTVKVKENIPLFIFTLEIPMDYDGKFLFTNLKKKISFEFDEMEKREVK